MFSGFDDHMMGGDDGELSPTIRGETDMLNSNYETTIQGQRYAPAAFQFDGLKTQERRTNPYPQLASGFDRYYQEPDPYAGDEDMNIAEILDENQDSCGNDPAPSPTPEPVPPVDSQKKTSTWKERCKNWANSAWSAFNKHTAFLFHLIFWLMIVFIFLAIIEKLKQLFTKPNANKMSRF